ncbi:MAG: lysophospholipid acyltransferase family protein [Thiothrix sp.]|uniref:lysophospholipid acyltransferase family protein n=1 Tax=Thiothrix sp. TaxID=1032 RepID=UPI002609E77B|nr:lysophospholipid acyltransferase family protein [Thiothrix sp.]MDD5393198.1 lysophospholipid acyltransferase family protein [Thiothrix sp.]
MTALPPTQTIPVKDRLRGSLFIGLMHILSTLPLQINHALGAALGLLSWYLPNKLRSVTLQNLQIAYPQLSEAERLLLAKQSLIELGKTTTEIAPLWLWQPTTLLKKIVEVRGLALFEQAQQHGKGVMILTPHLGAWELFSPYLASKSAMTALYRPPRLSSLEAFTVRARERTGATLVPTNARGVKALRKAFAENQVSVILPDQDPGKSSGVYADFFGHPAKTMTLASRLAQTAQAAVLWGIAERLPKGRGYRIHFLPVNPEFTSPDELLAARALNEGVEQCIAIAPAQYMWSYKRYKNTPPGQSNPYSA